VGGAKGPSGGRRESLLSKDLEFKKGTRPKREVTSRGGTEDRGLADVEWQGRQNAAKKKSLTSRKKTGGKNSQAEDREHACLSAPATETKK